MAFSTCFTEFRTCFTVFRPPIQANRHRDIGQNSVKYRPIVPYTMVPATVARQVTSKRPKNKPVFGAYLRSENEACSEGGH